ncbi:MAG: AAA family ATPase [Candidatus Margulisiibacteriota bacterium]
MKSIIKSIRLQGYRLFDDITVPLNRLSVFLGENGVGKSSVFGFLSALRDSLNEGQMTPELWATHVGTKVFFNAQSSLLWSLKIEADAKLESYLFYQGELKGPLQRLAVVSERIKGTAPNHSFDFMQVKNQEGIADDPERKNTQGTVSHWGIKHTFRTREPNSLGLAQIKDPSLGVIASVKHFISGWRLYKAETLFAKRFMDVGDAGKDTFLAEDASNLPSLLYELQHKNPTVFQAIEAELKTAFPAILSLTVNQKGLSRECMVLASVQEVSVKLPIYEWSDAWVRFLCWVVLCLHPQKPTVMGIKFPDAGLHASLLPQLHRLFLAASEQTQVILDVQNPVLIGEFELENLVLFKRTEGGVVCLKAKAQEGSKP